MERYLDRKEQSEYLASRGVRYSRSTLDKLASTGGGPRYVRIGNRALSTPEWLEEWIAAQAGKPRRHTSEPAA